MQPASFILLGYLLIIGCTEVNATIIISSQESRCVMQECCNDDYIRLNSEGLRYDLQEHFYGQHLVPGTVLNAISGHFNNRNPRKALVLSFHGWAGTGKTFVSNIIIKNIFRRGMNSKFVLFVLGPHGFAQANIAGDYFHYIQQLVVSSVRACGRSLFVFDDIDHIPEGVLDALYPYVTNYQKVDGIDFRKSMFLFLSNNGGYAIYEKTYQHWKQGNLREDLKLYNIEHSIKMEVNNANGGLHGSQLIEEHLVDHFVPFLPLEREHVRSCIYAEMDRKRCSMTPRQVDEVLDMLQWVPPDLRLFSNSGCKRVSQKIDLIQMDDEL